jgi:hypothetical protein
MIFAFIIVILRSQRLHFLAFCGKAELPLSLLADGCFGAAICVA